MTCGGAGRHHEAEDAPNPRAGSWGSCQTLRSLGLHCCCGVLFPPILSRASNSELSWNMKTWLGGRSVTRERMCQRAGRHRRTFHPCSDGNFLISREVFFMLSKQPPSEAISPIPLQAIHLTVLVAIFVGNGLEAQLLVKNCKTPGQGGSTLHPGVLLFSPSMKRPNKYKHRHVCTLSHHPTSQLVCYHWSPTNKVP